MKRGVNMKRSSSPMSRQTDSPILGENVAGVSLADKLIETIRNLTSNRDLVMTRLATLNGSGLKTASIMEVAGMYRSLVAQVAVLYDTDDFQSMVAPYIEKRFKEIGSPSLTPGTVGSYIFGCYLSDYGIDSLNKFCTPICAASIRVPNRERINMRCTEKVIWTDGGDTPVFILIDEDPDNAHNGKVFIPWVGDATSFIGLTQGAIDEIRSLGVENIEIYGQLFNNKYLQLQTRKNLSEIQVVERIRLRVIDYVNSKNGGLNVGNVSTVATDIASAPLSPSPPTTPPSVPPVDDTTSKANTSEQNPEDPTVEKKYDLAMFIGVSILIVGVLTGAILLFLYNKKKK
jgi:hypothetical protein